MSANFLSKRISLLERAYKTTLMTRHVDGIRLTPEGRQVLEAAKRMEEASFGLDRALSQATPALSGEVRLAVTEGLGTFWLAPRLVDFQRACPGMSGDLKCERRSADVLRLEADVAVQLQEPENPDLKRIKIGRLHIMPFVSPSYVDVYGMPKDEDDIRQNHRIVLQDADQTKGKELYDKYAHREQIGFVAMRNNVSTAHLWSIAKGAGIGWLPTYVPALGDPLIPPDNRPDFSRSNERVQSMKGGGIDGPIDQLVKARWLAIGLSQTDLAEVLGAASPQTQKDDSGPDGADTSRLMQVAEELDLPLDFFHSPALGAGPNGFDHSADPRGSLQSLLELRLLRAFHELRDHRTKRMLIRLAGQIVRRNSSND